MSTSECFCSSKNQIDMKAEKSLVVPVVAQEHLRGRQRRPFGDGVHLDGLRLLVGQLAGIELAQGMSLSMSQRTDSSCLNSSG